MSIKVLFVCMGNICRSPTADAVMQHKVNAAGLADRVSVDSAGTISHHVGASPDKRAQAAAKERGYNMSKLRARQLVAEDFDSFDYILAMDLDNLEVIKELQPADYRGNAGLFLQFLPESDYEEVPDPYYGGSKGFQVVLNLVEQGCDALIEDIRGKLQG
jgi:protein-tyrosine phosphatase